MQPGHPYDTKELEEMRSAQRRVLRDVPDELLTVGRLRLVEAGVDGVSDRHLAEFSVRRRIEQMRAEPKVADVIAVWETARRAEAFADVIMRVPHDMRTSSALRAALDALQQQATDEDQAAKGNVAQTRSDYTEQRVGELVLLLQLADALATDFRDPRLPQPKSMYGP